MNRKALHAAQTIGQCAGKHDATPFDTLNTFIHYITACQPLQDRKAKRRGSMHPSGVMVSGRLFSALSSV